MPKFAIVFVALALAAPAVAQVRVKAYVKTDGTYVAPYVRTAPDHSLLNNYSTAPNVNPYTGKVGTVNPYAPKPAPQPCYYNCKP